MRVQYDWQHEQEVWERARERRRRHDQRLYWGEVGTISVAFILYVVLIVGTYQGWWW